MAPPKSIWYHLGHAYERARLGSSDARGAVARRADEPPRRRREPAPERAPTETAWPAGDELVSAAAWLVLDRVVGATGRRRRPGVAGLVKAGAAGGAAALLLELVRPILRGEAALPALERETLDRVIAGVAQGLVYGALVEPRVPGSALVKGALYGSVEFATDPMGGLGTLLGPHTPQGRLPVVGALLAGTDRHDRAYLEHLVFGIALAILYEPDRSSRGTRELDEEEEDEDGAGPPARR